MPEPALMFWILGAPLLLAVIDLVRTMSSLKRMPASATGRGPWSKVLHVKGG